MECQASLPAMQGWLEILAERAWLAKPGLPALQDLPAS